MLSGMRDVPEATRASEAGEGHTAYRDLPVLGTENLRHAWDQFEVGDTLGSLNRISPERVLEAIRSVKGGDVISLDLPIGSIDPPLFDRPPVKHTIVQTGRNFFEDKLDDFYLQASSQWDGFGHIRYREHGFWQGRLEEPRPGGELGIDAWAEKGVVGHGVLLDVSAYRIAVGRPIRHGSNEPVTPQDLSETAAHFGIVIAPGDILCVRTGWITWYRQLDQAGREGLQSGVTSPGLIGTDEMAALLWDWQIAALTADNPAIEPAPGDSYLHRRLIPLLGMAIGELFDLDALAEASAGDGRYDFLFMSAPLRLAGGLGSPANALALR
ncbi:cyclase family protein [soil metagenome]